MNVNIQKLLSQGERVTFECKKAQRNVPNSLWDTYLLLPTHTVVQFYLVCMRT